VARVWLRLKGYKAGQCICPTTNCVVIPVPLSFSGYIYRYTSTGNVCPWVTVMQPSRRVASDHRHPVFLSLSIDLASVMDRRAEHFFTVYPGHFRRKWTRCMQNRIGFIHRRHLKQQKRRALWLTLSGRQVGDRRLFDSTFFLSTQNYRKTIKQNRLRQCPLQWVRVHVRDRIELAMSRYVAGHTNGIVATVPERETSHLADPIYDHSISVNSVEPQACAEVVRQ
jgi:hypothetical protein